MPRVHGGVKCEEVSKGDVFWCYIIQSANTKPKTYGHYFLSMNNDIGKKEGRREGGKKGVLSW